MVLSCFLNALKVKTLRTLSGSAFHNMGAAHEKARSPKAYVGVWGTLKRFASEDRSGRGVGLGLSSCAIYWGASPCKALKVRSTILYSIRFLTGSQWSSFSIGVMRIVEDVNVMIRAAMFSIRWSRLSWLSGRPKNVTLPLPSLDVTNACISFSHASWVMHFLMRPILKIW